MKLDHFESPMRDRQSPLQVGYHVVEITVVLHLSIFVTHLDLSK
jgi:hypothetical protein